MAVLEEKKWWSKTNMNKGLFVLRVDRFTSVLMMDVLLVSRIISVNRLLLCLKTINMKLIIEMIVDLK